MTGSSPQRRASRAYTGEPRLAKCSAWLRKGCARSGSELSDPGLSSGLVECRAGLLGNLAEGGRVAHREIGEHLPVERDLGLAQPGNALVVREPLAPCRRVDPHDPEPPERALLVLAVAVRVGQRVIELLLRALVARMLLAPVAAGLLEHLAALFPRVDGPLDAWHSSTSPADA